MKKQHALMFDSASEMERYSIDARIGRAIRGSLVLLDSEMGRIAANDDKPFLPSKFRVAIREAFGATYVYGERVCPYEDIGLPKLEEKGETPSC